MKPAGMFPTPYGVSVPVMRRDDAVEGADDEFLFSMESAAILAGIHDAGQRRRLWAAAQEGDGRVRLEDFGGRVVPRLALPRPLKPVYPELPRGYDLDIPIENWITLAMDLHRWCDRAKKLIGIIDENIENGASMGGMPAEIMGLAIGQILTATLEHLAEKEIDCLEAASLYALTMHAEWRSAGERWLEPFKDTWFRDWRDARPDYTRFAGITRRLHTEIPAWIVGGVS